MKLNQVKLRQLLIGAAFFSTGGGGSLDEGLEVIKDIEEITLIDVNAAASHQLCATAYLVGTINPPKLDELRQNNNIAFKDANDLVVEAFQYLQKRLGKEINYIVPVELGGYNTAVSLYLAAKMRLRLLDADLTGRSAPEMFQTGYFVGGISPSPAGAVTIFGEKIFIEEAHDYKRFDDLLRSMVAISAGYDVGVANFPLPIKEARPYLLRNTLSMCVKIGALLEKGEVFEAIQRANGKIIFTGKLKEERYREEGGFTQGSVILENKDGRLRLEYKNEILVSFLNGKLIASVPELIGVVTATGKPVINTQFPVGQELIVYAIPAPFLWKTSKGRAVFDLKHFGYPKKVE
ncbi:DUF917 domain-containing protein [Calditrichota bacterium GD2]